MSVIISEIRKGQDSGEEEAKLGEGTGNSQVKQMQAKSFKTQQELYVISL